MVLSRYQEARHTDSQSRDTYMFYIVHLSSKRQRQSLILNSAPFTSAKVRKVPKYQRGIVFVWQFTINRHRANLNTWFVHINKSMLRMYCVRRNTINAIRWPILPVLCTLTFKEFSPHITLVYQRRRPSPWFAPLALQTSGLPRERHNLRLTR